MESRAGLECRSTVQHLNRAARPLRAGVVLLGVTVLVACGATAPSITPATRVSPTPATTPTPTPGPKALATPAATAGAVPVTKLLTKCPAPRSFASLQRFASVADAADIDVAPDGSVWVSTDTRNTITHLSASGAAMASFPVPFTTGVLALPSGMVLFGDYGDDRIDELNPTTGAVSTFLQLKPQPGQSNVTGLGLDSANGLVLVPDTAQGQLLTIPTSGGTAKVLATGIPQPVDAAVGPGAAIQVASSSITALLSVPNTGGAATPYKSLALHLSSVVVSGLLVYFTATPSKRVYAFNPATGNTAVLVTAIGNPLGLALLRNGQLVVSDAVTGTLATFHTC
jgi:hypothetical protein